MILILLVVDVREHDDVHRQVGETIEGTIEPRQGFPSEFKQAAKQNGYGGGGGSRQEDPRKSAEIRRMASQKVAVALLAAEVAAGLTFENQKASELLKPRIQFFEDDAREAGEKA